MKNFILVLLSMMTFSGNIYCQTIQRGNVFTAASNRSAKKDTVITKYFYEIKGKQYPIILNRKSNKAYIWRISKKGKGYRQYLSEDIVNKINSE